MTPSVPSDSFLVPPHVLTDVPPFSRQSLSKPLVTECAAALAVVAQTQEPKCAPLEALQALAEHAEELSDALTDLSQRCSVLVSIVWSASPGLARSGLLSV